MSRPRSFHLYLQQVFTKGAALLILFLLCLFGAFLACFYEVHIVDGTDAHAAEAEQAVSREWDRCARAMNELGGNPALIQALQTGKADRELAQYLYDITNSGTIHGDFLLLDQSRKPVMTSLYQDNLGLVLENRDIQDMLHRAGTGSTGVLRYGPVVLPLQHGQQEQYYLLLPVQGHAETAGFLFLFFRQEGFQEWADQWPAEQIVILDTLDHVIFSTNPLFVDAMGKLRTSMGVTGAQSVQGRSYYVGRPARGDKLQVIAFTAIPHTDSLLQAVLLFLGCIGIAACLAVFLVARKLSCKVLKPLDGLLVAVREGKNGNLDYRLEPEQSLQEFQVIYQEFNRMMREIHQLMERNKELAERKRLMEVRNLEGQMDPHFAFNVMEGLRYEILFDPKKASELAVSFARLMRYSIHRGEGDVSLETDLQYVKDYLALQKMRFGERLSYDIAMDPLLYDCQIPKLLLQPVVENSIVHGLENVRSIHINITGKREEDMLVLSVVDNGAGINPEKMAELRKLLVSDVVAPSHIGLYNVHRVLRLRYGGNAGIRIDGDVHGFRVFLYLPMVKKEVAHCDDV